ncbi:DnaJ domain-containing protein [Xanthomonas sp. Kuri4-1]
MRWYGKLLGFLAGALLFRPNPLFGAAVGLLIGHAFDRDWFKLNHDNPYRELGLTADATNAEIDLAYRRLMSQYHPDKVAGAAPELRQQAERKASQINAAYDRIQRLRRKP